MVGLRKLVTIQDEATEVSSPMEDELLSEQDDLKPKHAEQYLKLLQEQEQEDSGPMPLDEYIQLRFRLLTKRCPRSLDRMVLVFIGCIMCGMLVAAAIHQAINPSSNLRVSHREPVATAHHLSACNYKKTGYCPARSLFQSPEIHRVITDNLMRTNNRLLTQADHEIVQDFVWNGLKKINAELEARAPVAAKELEKVQFNEIQKNAVLDLLALLSDPSVQSLGFDVAKIIRHSKFTTKKFLKFYIEDSLNPIDEIQKLAHEIIPKSVLALWGKGGHDWEMTLEPRNINYMRTGHIKKPDNITGVDFETKSISIYAGVLHVGRVLLDIMKIHTHVVGFSWPTDMRNAVELIVKDIVLPTESNKLAFMEAFLMPLKCGAQGLDALRASVSQEYGHTLKH